MYQGKPIENPISAEEVRDIIGRTEEIQSNRNSYADPVDTVQIGIVTGCKKLNIREEPNASAAIVCEVACQTELMINENESTDEFYKVCTVASVEGFCMKRFIAIQ